MHLWKFIGKRLLFVIPQLFAVSVIVFFLARLLPGDPSYLLAGPYATPERIQEVRSNLGLDQPIIVQYGRYLERILEGDFGTSWRTSQPVLKDIQQRLPATLQLVVGAVFLSVMIGVPLGIAVALRKGGFADK